MNNTARRVLLERYPTMPEPLPAHFVRDVRKLFLEVNQTRLADIVGVTTPTVSNWENGRTLCTGAPARLMYLVVKYPGLIKEIDEREAS